MKVSNLVAMTILGILVLIPFFGSVTAEPGGNDTVNATAGNVTQLFFNVSGQDVTNRWAGFFGNLSGQILLDDASNFSLYQWNGDLDPAGEVYAADAQVGSWSHVRCLNITSSYPGVNCSENLGGDCLNITELQNKTGGDVDARDSFNNTFIYQADLTIGTTTHENCPATYLFNTNQEADANFTEVMLTENNTETVIYASIINNDYAAFDNSTWDFVMLVGEDGDSAGTQTYYFYTELS